VDEFFEHFGLEYSSFAERAFAVMDVERTGEGSGRLDFCEFFIGLYNYCTMSHDHLVKFAFDLFDIDGGGEIGKAELMELVRMVYGKKEVEGTVMKLLKADKDKNGQVSILEFREMERTSRSLLFPAFDLQRKMAEKIMGKAYWDKATKRRKLAIGDTQDVIELHYATYHKKKLNRKEVNDNASVIREGVLKVDSDVRAEPTGGTGRGAALVREIKKGEQVTIYEERDVEGNLWYLINGKEGEWVMANDIKVPPPPLSLSLDWHQQNFAILPSPLPAQPTMLSLLCLYLPFYFP
jgi:Ca2+-binding EF-hand superfamily protein